MAHKTITISERAYDALARRKEKNESFTDVILKMTSEKGSAALLLQYIESTPRNDNLADNIEDAMKRTRRAKLRSLTF